VPRANRPNSEDPGHRVRDMQFLRRNADRMATITLLGLFTLAQQALLGKTRWPAGRTVG
jgi:hypothetical protein